MKQKPKTMQVPFKWNHKVEKEDYQVYKGICMLMGTTPSDEVRVYMQSVIDANPDLSARIREAIRQNPRTQFVQSPQSESAQEQESSLQTSE